jgi:uncharacterized protein with HEPN domain
VSKDKQRLADFLAHMLSALERINCYTELMDELGFLQNELVQAAQHPELPLAFAY